VQDAAGIVELSTSDYLARVDAFLAIYAAAMGATPDELPSRRAIMERHAGNLRFRALASYNRASAGNGSEAEIVAFTYGFHGQPGQWWHDVVRSGVTASAGVAAADAWLGDVMEIAEVHVHPDFQSRGIGRAMITALTAGRGERTALLSTRDAATPARHLYRTMGFNDLLTDFLFPGGGPRYAVMGAQLPLARR
jgi:ribosomal protein S18 acetylase RimI-like enzyme